MQNTKKVSFYIIASNESNVYPLIKWIWIFTQKIKLANFTSFSKIKKISSIRSDAIWREFKKKKKKYSKKIQKKKIKRKI